ncbi:MAG: type II toxin-antitoxin system HigB family toxin [Candidatus Competibacteraceae bacterium]
MHVITQKRIWEAKEEHNEAANALDGWYRLMKANRFDSFAALKDVFGSVDKVGNLYVFDIGGNKLRLIASILFEKNKVFIRHVLTHKEYDRGKWKE